jgi:capsular polysaccharide transport system permease protein
MALGYMLVIWFSFSFVLIMAALAELSDTIERLSHIILYLMLPFCGVFIPLFAVPLPYRDYLELFPLVDAVEYFHHGYYGHAMLTYYDIPYTLFSLLALTLFSLALTNLSIRRTQLN